MCGEEDHSGDSRKPRGKIHMGIRTKAIMGSILVFTIPSTRCDLGLDFSPVVVFPLSGIRMDLWMRDTLSLSGIQIRHCHVELGSCPFHFGGNKGSHVLRMVTDESQSESAGEHDEQHLWICRMQIGFRKKSINPDLKSRQRNALD